LGPESIKLISQALKQLLLVQHNLFDEVQS